MSSREPGSGRRQPKTLPLLGEGAIGPRAGRRNAESKQSAARPITEDRELASKCLPLIRTRRSHSQARPRNVFFVRQAVFLYSVLRQHQCPFANAPSPLS
jgi:hypothetical protein